MGGVGPGTVRDFFARHFFGSRKPQARPVPRIPDGLRLYVIGDVHGRADLLEQIAAEIERDRRSWSGETSTVLLGDYIDRGPRSRDVIEMISCGKLGQHVALKGNHEEMVLAFLEKPDAGLNWLTNGGRETLLSYAVPTSPILRVADLPSLSARLNSAMPETHRAFLQSLRLTFRAGDYLFCHAGVRPGVPLERQREADLLWIRDDFLRSSADHGARVVHGHTPSEEVEIRPNRINLDTGAYLTGRLTCLVLQGAEFRTFQTPIS